ncbi:MAG: cytochrome b/b6 domain-containing protein [Acetobacteraceae bacterium]|nr:cytochrome b/b6 domain-containing protein [Acetobacteraceae bacterium]
MRWRGQGRVVLGPAWRQGETVRVWDLGVRAFHWMLAASASAAALTGFVLGRTTLAWHLVAGVTVIAAVTWRLIWGLLGPTYARFASFAHRPAIVLAHLHGLPARRHDRHLGHNPLGAMMVFAFLVVLAAITLTGTVALGGVLKQGPLRAFMSYAAGRQWLAAHNVAAILLLIMIGAHLAGVLFESRRGQENLVAAMLTGDKPLQPPAEVVPSARPHPRLALAITLSVLAAAAAGTAVLAALPGRGVPPATLDPMFEEQCGACHLAFPPSLAPGATWDSIMGDLKHHFGADATLSPEQVAHLRAWLDANSAEHWDTLPSHLLRTRAADGSLRITDTPGWRRMHRHIPDAVFAAKPVYRRSNCAACHADAATGRFAPQSIAIPPASASQ